MGIFSGIFREKKQQEPQRGGAGSDELVADLTGRINSLNNLPGAQRANEVAYRGALENAERMRKMGLEEPCKTGKANDGDKQSEIDEFNERYKKLQEFMQQLLDERKSGKTENTSSMETPEYMTRYETLCLLEETTQRDKDIICLPYLVEKLHLNIITPEEGEVLNGILGKNRNGGDSAKDVTPESFPADYAKALAMLGAIGVLDIVSSEQEKITPGYGKDLRNGLKGGKALAIKLGEMDSLKYDVNIYLDTTRLSREIDLRQREEEHHKQLEEISAAHGILSPREVWRGTIPEQAMIGEKVATEQFIGGQMYEQDQAITKE